MIKFARPFALFLLLMGATEAYAQAIYEMPVGASSRLSSFENPNGIKGNGGRSNKTAKGNAFEVMKPGDTKSMLDVKGEGMVQRIWLTVDQNPVKLRSLRLQCYWDGDAKPAVDVPMGDFFCHNLGKRVAFQSALFSSAEGRSFNCYISMPFRKSARIVLINEGKEDAKLFYDVDFILQNVPATALYFHAYWRRQIKSSLGDDFTILPRVNGKGRFLGMSVGLMTDSAYGKSWWGEGEVKMYMDGDDAFPTIAGTGSEDYIGSAWGLGTFTNLYQGCTVANDSAGLYSFYRLHVPDAIYFNHDIRVVIQQIGGWGRDELRELYKRGVKLKPVTADGPSGFYRLFDMPDPPKLTDSNFPDGWINFYRMDDYAAVSYFYLDRTSSQLAALAPVAERILYVK